MFALCLLFFALALCANKICNITDYGAVGDGKTLNTKFIQAAINDCASGSVIVPQGRFLTGGLNLTQSNFAFVVQGTLLGSTDPTDYPIVPWQPSYPTGRDIPGPQYQPLLWVLNQTNVIVTGGGVVDGQGAVWWKRFKDKTLQHGRPRLLQTMFSSYVLIRDITLVNSAFWTTHLYASSFVEVAHVKIRAPFDSPNTDGVDPDSSNDVWIHDIDVENGDDGIAVKSGLDAAGRAFNRPSKNILIENSVFRYSHGLSVGSEISGGVQNVTFRNISLAWVAASAYIKTSIARGGYIKDILYSNIQANIVGEAVRLRVDYDHSTPSPVPTDIDGVRFEHMHVIAGDAGQLTCSNAIPCKNVQFDDVTVYAPIGWSCTNVTGTQSHTYPKISCLK